MPFRPHSLPYKLRRLFDAKVLSPADLARSCGVTVSRVDGWLRGRTPDPVTRLQIDKVLSYYTRRSGDRHLKLEDGNELETEDRPEEGIFEATDPPVGQVEIKARNAVGERIGLFQVRADAIDDQLVDDLERWYQRHSSIPLTLSDASPGASS